MYRDVDDEDGDEFDGVPLDRAPARRSSPIVSLVPPPQPQPTRSLLEQLRDRGLIQPDEHEHDQLQTMLERAMQRTFDARYGRRPDPSYPHPHAHEHRRPIDEPRARVGDEPDQEHDSPGIGWAGALALLGLGWLVASYASEGKK